MFKQGEKLSVYVIEDSKIICDILLRLPLFIENVRVTTFINGESALESIKKSLPDVIILDYYLNTGLKQNINGDEVLKSIKQISPEIPVIILSGLADPQKIKQLHDIGVNGFIHKSEENLLDNIVESLKGLSENKEISLQ